MRQNPNLRQRKQVHVIKKEIAYNENGVIKTEQIHSNFRWTSESTRILLEIRFARNNEFQSGLRQKKDLWTEVGLELGKRTGLKVSGEVCDLKYRNLLQTYKKNKIKAQKGMQTTIVWEFFDLFNDAMKSFDEHEDILPTMFCESICLGNENNEEEKTYNGNLNDSLSTILTSTKIEKRKNSMPSDRSATMKKRVRHESISDTQSNATPNNYMPLKIENENSSTLNLSSAENKECEIFGESVGIQLANIKDSAIRALLQLKIQELLFQAKVGNLMQNN